MAVVLVEKKFKIPCFLEALLQGLRWFYYIILLDSGGRELRGLVLPCRPVVVDQASAGGRPTLSWHSFSSTATASEAGAVSQPAPLCWGGSPLLPSFPACSAPEAGLVSHSAPRLPCGGILGHPGSPVRDRSNSSFQAAATASRPQQRSFHSFFLAATASRPLAPPFGGGTGGSAFRPTAPSPLTSMAYPIRGPGCCQRGGSV